MLIPRFFRTLFDGGVNEVQFLVKQTKEMFHNPVITLDCEQASMIISFGKPAHIKVDEERIDLNALHLSLIFRFVTKEISLWSISSMI